MHTFDHDYAFEVIERLHGLRPDARPAWGALTPAAMARHLGDTVLFSMGRRGSRPRTGNWFMRAVAGPLLMHGLLRMPKNLESPIGPVAFDGLSAYEGEVETLSAVIEDYLGLVQSGDLEPEPHPVFGAIGVDGWGRLHVIHFEHHLGQFGV
ncbi:MAG: DUF1569 domain-containing protein [Candidatus Hydrogenedentes bacterium]|nr:DUF1569 domain-containing protein [Candidatus Hydrogenedentota bacterium]